MQVPGKQRRNQQNQLQQASQTQSESADRTYGSTARSGSAEQAYGRKKYAGGAGQSQPAATYEKRVHPTSDKSPAHQYALEEMLPVGSSSLTPSTSLSPKDSSSPPVPQGHIDEQGTCLMLDDKSYQQYLQAQQSWKQREEEQKAAKQRQAEQKKEQRREAKKEAQEISPEIQEMVQEGGRYITSLREANDAIPGEVISAKLDKLELIISKIFESVIRHPEQAGEMKKFMKYYLPTTLKLVNTYREFDGLPVKGENVTTAMTEIERTMDTIIVAFEKLLDDLFQDTAFDVSADISVLEAMFAREGYKESDF